MGAARKLLEAAPAPAQASAFPHRAHAARERALADHKRDLSATTDRELAALRQRAEDLRAAHAQAIADAERDAAETAAKLDAALAADVKATIWPILAKFADAPRSSSIALMGAWRVLSARAEEELGDRLDPRHLAFGFVNAMGPDAIDRAGGRFLMYGTGNVPAAQLAANLATEIEHGLPASIEAAARALEIAVGKEITQARAGMGDRARAFLAHATTRTADKAIAAHDNALRPHRPCNWNPEDG